MSHFEFEVDPKNLRVDIGMPVHFPYVPFPTTVSLVDTVRICTKHQIQVRQVSPIGCSIVTDARSAVVDEFLKGDATHLFWIDSDIHWHPSAFLRLLALSTKVNVVGATYPLKMDPIRFMVRGLGEKIEEPYGLVETTGLGLGFTVMTREVVEKVAAGRRSLISNGGKTPIREVFELRRHEETGHRIGEDMAFFEDIRALGYKTWLDPMTNVAHIGMKLYAGNVLDAITKKA